MNNSMKSAVLAITLATASMKAANLNANVPMEFQIGKQMHRAGAYQIAPQRPGVVILKTADGAAVGVRIMQVQTTDSRETRNSITFARNAKGNFEFAGYCISGVGCWASGIAPASSKIEVAMFTGK